ncbi:peptide-methionine (R)-S-oxide reductase MsrB [Rufibacter latericius]|uniref:peptide-methionine (R)-S-oxide reductase n=1 Tax=Rufibacter latericius TaxID=2487040 RepID=A0A3M9MVP4_9BACT|nr:peptide-methionine (R)-S-oxide reductase MsrB [Rufibacter latericius]RNI29187.1 peptide-methionine (R)-S-oxide reductase [Rufibacter latericius]
MIRWSDVIKYAKYSNPEPATRVERTELDWQQILTPAQFRILRLKETESPYRNAYCRSYEPGVYACAGCGNLLFDSSQKYHAISGWPSFTQPLTKSALKYLFDDTHHMHRVEVQCNVCDGHLGHVFPDGPPPHGLRYCINSESLVRLEAVSGKGEENA